MCNIHTQTKPSTPYNTLKLKLYLKRKKNYDHYNSTNAKKLITIIIAMIEGIKWFSVLLQRLRLLFFLFTSPILIRSGRYVNITQNFHAVMKKTNCYAVCRVLSTNWKTTLTRKLERKNNNKWKKNKTKQNHFVSKNNQAFNFSFVSVFSSFFPIIKLKTRIIIWN